MAITAGWLSAAAGLAAASPSPDELILAADSGYEVEAEVNGTRLRLRVDPGATGVIVLNPSAAERAGLRARPMDARLADAIGIEHVPTSRVQTVSVAGREVPLHHPAPSRIPVHDAKLASAATRLGPVKVRGKLSLARTVIAGQSSEKVFGWFGSKVISGADGVISPASLPFGKVTFRLGQGSSAITEPILFPVQFQPLEGLTYRHPLSRQDLTVRFSVLAPLTTATAAAGAVMATQYDGKWTGEARSHGVGLGVLRPARPMRLAAPASFKGFQLSELLVRVGDHRGGYKLPVDGVVSKDDILVVARSPQEAQLTLVIGQDATRGCSTISYVRPDRIELVCP